MFRSKRDVDKHVDQLEAKIQSETERNLKALTIAKLYLQVSEFESARKYAAKYLSVRENSSTGWQVHGRALEQLGQSDKALTSFKTALELDASSKELILKIIDLISRQTKFEEGKAKYWLEQGELHYPRHNLVAKLRGILQGDDGADHHNGADSVDVSPEGGNPGDSSILWSQGATNSFLNGSVSNANRRTTLGGGRYQTPDRSAQLNTSMNASLIMPHNESYSGTPRRFVPRPSPERMEAQVRSLESTQERLADQMAENQKVIVEEIKNHRMSVLEELKSHRQNVVDLKIEVKQGLHDVKLEVARVCQAIKDKDMSGGNVTAKMDTKDITEALAMLPRQIANAMPPPPAPQIIHQQPRQQAAAAESGQRGLSLNEMQEALAQQTALLQMSSLGFASSMFARSPASAQVPGQLPPMVAQQAMAAAAAAAAAQQQQQQLQQAAPMPQQPMRNPQENVWTPPPAQQQPQTSVTVTLPQTPISSYETKNVSSTPASAPKTPATPQQQQQQPASGEFSPHGYHINLPRNVTNVTTSPFKDQSGPAVPITTTALLSTVPKPVFSSLEKFKPKTGSWECQGCFMRNEPDIIQCPACQTAQPGHEEEVKKMEAAAKPTMSFGAAGGFSFSGGAAAPAPAAGGGFKFGSQPAAPAATTASPAGGGFKFGSGGGSAAAPAPTKEAAKDGHLSFDGQGMKLNTEEDAKDVANKIANTTGMRELTLSGNTIGIDAAKAIGKALEGHPEFEIAHWKDMFTGRMKTEIPPALLNLSSGVLKANVRLVELDLSDNAFGPIGMDGIKDLLKSPSCYTLKELKLNNTGCGVTGGKLLAKTLLDCYNESKKAGTPLALKVFVLGRSRQENEGAKALAQVFKLMGSLEEVVMPQNGIYHEGIAALTDAFACNPNLRILNMNDNTFTEKGAKCLADALPKMQKLQTLNLGDCLLKTEGATLIADALKPGHLALEFLHLDSNEVKVEGGEAIVDAMANKNNMKQLEIGNNQFGEEGCAMLLNKLRDLNRRDLIGEDIESDEGSSDEEDGEDYDGEDGEDETDTDDEEEAERKNEVAASMFGAAKPASSIFGGAAASTNTAEERAANSPFKNLNMFSGNKDATTNGNTSGIFGGAAAASSAGGIFGGGSGATSIFGGGKPSASPSMFGGSTPAKSAGDENKSIFGTPAASSSIFTPKTPENSSNGDNKGIDLSASKDLSSFASVASGTGGFSFRQKTEGFSFAGQGKTLFGGAKPAGSPSKGGDDDDDDADGNDDQHDPHFEPIIPLPELVEVKTGEEDEEILFKNRGKVYRYDPDTKQWKERGVGDMKILKHPIKNTFRVLLRREQIFKIACNHNITTEMELKPMFGSENAVCWFAMDYSEDEYKLEHLAVRFKHAATKDEFKKTFESCQQTLKDKPASPVKAAEAPKPSTPSTSGVQDIPTAVTEKTPEKAVAEPAAANSTPVPSFAFPSLKPATPAAAPAGGATGGFTFGKIAEATSGFSFSSPVVSKPAGSPQKEDEPENDEEHDPHFEPIIPLPELIEVKTGEEDEEVVFQFRSKVYRYDPDTKQWKERGVGDLKILKHPSRNTFRVLLRRDQIFKIAVNHLINTEMELKPMAGSDNAVCWFAMDFAEDESKLEHLAARFKLTDTKDEFKKKFEECQAMLKANPSSPAKKEETPVPAADEGDDAQHDDADDEDDEEEEAIMYERECELFEAPKEDAAGGSDTSLGHVDLRIIYDDDVYGARIIATRHEASASTADENTVCNHLIAMQTQLDEGELKCSWSALDFSIDPPTYRAFVAKFNSEEDAADFRDTFFEGKELADQAEILELPAQQDDPQDYYYGQGADYDES